MFAPERRMSIILPKLFFSLLMNTNPQVLPDLCKRIYHSTATLPCNISQAPRVFNTDGTVNSLSAFKNGTGL